MAQPFWTPGDETGMSAPEEVVQIPEVDNSAVLAALNPPPGEQILERYKGGGDRPPVRARIEAIQSDGKAVRHGAYVEFYRDGGKFCEGVYANGRRQGAWQYWYPGGQLAKIGHYDQDRPVGTWYYLRPNKILERTEAYVDGRQDGRWLTFGPDGKMVLSVRRFKQGEPNGKWYAWYSATAKRFEYDFVDGLQHGVAKAWYPDGTQWFEGQYVNGKRDGEWQEWDRSGRLLKHSLWRDGRQVASPEG